jgi:hypothetical protein
MQGYRAATDILINQRTTIHTQQTAATKAHEGTASTNLVVQYTQHIP